MSKIVFTGGTFDLLHEGHINLLREAKRLGTVVVGLNTDEFVTRFKRLPILNYGERRSALLACKYVDAVVKNLGDFDSKLILDVICPDIYIHGDDWTGASLMKQLGVPEDYFEKNGIEVIYFPYTKGISSSDIISRIKSR